MFELRYKYKGETDFVQLNEADPTLYLVLQQVCKQSNITLETVKVIAPRKSKPLYPSNTLCSEAGLMSGSQVMILGSSAEQLKAVRSTKQDVTIVGFDEELRRAARKINTLTNNCGYSAASTLGKARFTSYKVLQQPNLSPPPSESLKLLQQLATDPGIVHIMNTHDWNVGLLSEMPPEGKVGISAVCILGYNVNKGQEISLRLRTDDLKGFRKYIKIRETLIHELTHIVWGDHDINFKTLNSQLLKEVEQFETQNQGKRLGGQLDQCVQDMSHLQQYALSNEQMLMQNTAKSSGQTLAALTGNTQHTQHVNPREAAAKAAFLRNVQDNSNLLQNSGHQYEHKDPQTEELEKQMERLGSLNSDVAE
eukprot:TRINITY_DN1253_c0_g2_i3.p1 TRINITY_DN1253_c0_g2~~TRINITY_DN1253_c0_g2_i3.p1  ORF type:complete len:366 (-),score=26.81 TRINITY_DN1253_c0_g2_i3:378-1475(-)